MEMAKEQTTENEEKMRCRTWSRMYTKGEDQRIGEGG
jgi:hypothetical protein